MERMNGFSHFRDGVRFIRPLIRVSHSPQTVDWFFIYIFIYIRLYTSRA